MEYELKFKHTIEKILPNEHIKLLSSFLRLLDIANERKNTTCARNTVQQMLL